MSFPRKREPRKYNWLWVPAFRFVGRLSLSLLEPEKGWFNKGTYLGNKNSVELWLWHGVWNLMFGICDLIDLWRL